MLLLVTLLLALLYLPAETQLLAEAAASACIDNT
jgi:hypothetical protein